MRRGPTGRYEPVSVGGEIVRDFIPAPLPPDPPIEMTLERLRLLEAAVLALGHLDRSTFLLPDPEVFLYSYVRREAVFSSQIEGTQSTLTQLMLFELEGAPGVPFEDVQEVSNYVAALEHGVTRLQEGFPLCNRLIREMHRILLARGRGSQKSPGEFRRTQNWIGGTRPGDAHFVPPPAHRIPECMGNLERFLHDDQNPYPILIKAALAHVQFETIHPFLDGNGRIGRLLIAFILHHDKVLSRPLLYLSLYFKQHRERYYHLLDKVRTEGEWEAWIDFFLAGVKEMAENAVSTVQRLIKLFQQDEHAIHTGGGAVSTTLRVYQQFKRRPLLTLPYIHHQTKLTFPTVSKAVKRLEQLGIIREVTGRKRNRVFAYEAYLNILSEGTESI